MKILSNLQQLNPTHSSQMSQIPKTNANARIFRSPLDLFAVSSSQMGLVFKIHLLLPFLPLTSFRLQPGPLSGKLFLLLYFCRYRKKVYFVLFIALPDKTRMVMTSFKNCMFWFTIINSFDVNGKNKVHIVKAFFSCV